MNKFLNLLMKASLVCVLGWTTCSSGQTFRAEIGLKRTQVKANETFNVDTAIRNIGSNEQSLEIWDCAYPAQWTVDNPSVHVNGIDCLQNSLAVIKLKPGESYRRVVPVHIEKQVEVIVKCILAT